MRAGHAAEIDVGWIAGEPFLNTASFGSYVELVDAREELEGRIGKWPALGGGRRPGAAPRHARRRRARRATRGTLWLAFVGNCRYLPDGMAPTWRERLDDGQLDVRVVDARPPVLPNPPRAAPWSPAPCGAAGCSRRGGRPALTVASADGPLRLARDGETFDGADTFEIAKNGVRLAVFTPRRDGVG